MEALEQKFYKFFLNTDMGTEYKGLWWKTVILPQQYCNITTIDTYSALTMCQTLFLVQQFCEVRQRRRAACSGSHN